MNVILEKRIKEIEDISLEKEKLMDGVANDTLKWAGIGLGVGVGISAILLSFGAAAPAVVGGAAAARAAAKGGVMGWRSAKEKTAC
ncbi:hypothetical protein MITS9509_03195 [Synechococcus sp. MIT S9509]|uniref:hypothetical protein n=1 Tax=unclassified Synechococcus TaxID=2626047 RepID=UPI0007BBE425|nr:MULTISPECIES: hypothetical protein [unclassified Synechococcus]KZR84124.1 hypothetical protein MITS9504_03101 [Synechococcus sp. MIT S9504]KZR88869.1 hypothetical protein MITS9509_03195 [Synechococcus sp. MIT S9509]